jgi:hypothetical protein
MKDGVKRSLRNAALMVPAAGQDTTVAVVAIVVIQRRWLLWKLKHSWRKFAIV